MLFCSSRLCNGVCVIIVILCTGLIGYDSRRTHTHTFERALTRRKLSAAVCVRVCVCVRLRVRSVFAFVCAFVRVLARCSLPPVVCASDATFGRLHCVRVARTHTDSDTAFIGQRTVSHSVVRASARLSVSSEGSGIIVPDACI